MTQPLIERNRHRSNVERLLGDNPAVAILGARQVGKTTLAAEIAEAVDGPVHRFDLELPSDLSRLDEPELSLGPLDGLVVLDEIQRRPDLFPVLRALIDQRPDRRFLILGSAAPELLRQTSESLAGRVAMYDLPPLELHETGADAIDELWRRGGFPRSFTADDDARSFQWRLDFIRTFVERDLPALRSQVPSATTDRFWRMLCHVHGQVWNGARLASSLGVAESTVRRYLDLLTSALVVEQLRPWHENVGKRQVKSPKVYISDSGLLHALLDLPDRVAIERHPIVGASWEGFVIRQLFAAADARPDQRYFWGTHAGADLDLLVVRGNQRIGFEVKRTAAPKITASLRSAMETLRLDSAFVIHAGPHSFMLSPEIEAVAASELATRRF